MLSEDTPLGKLVDAQREITIHDLLTHTAGLSYGGNSESEVDRMMADRLAELGRDRRSASIEDVMDVVTSVPLAYQPGSAWRYSLATDILGYLVQVVSGVPFGGFLATRIFQPLGMGDTFFELPEAKAGRAATVYGPSEGGSLKPLFPPEARRVNAFDSGGGGLYSTLPDYLRFAQVLLNMGELDGVRLLGRKTVDLMTMNHLPMGIHPFENPGRGFGLGVDVAIDIAASRALGSVGAYGWGGRGWNPIPGRSQRGDGHVAHGADHGRRSLSPGARFLCASLPGHRGLIMSRMRENTRGEGTAN